MYPFGHGLSYSSFRYEQSGEGSTPSGVSPVGTLHRQYHIADLAASALLSDRHADIAFWLNVTNTGSVLSDVTALGFLSSNASYPTVSRPSGSCSISFTFGRWSRGRASQCSSRLPTEHCTASMGRATRGCCPGSTRWR